MNVSDQKSPVRNESMASTSGFNAVHRVGSLTDTDNSISRVHPSALVSALLTNLSAPTTARARAAKSQASVDGERPAHLEISLATDKPTWPELLLSGPISPSNTKSL